MTVLNPKRCADCGETEPCDCKKTTQGGTTHA